MKNAEMEIVKFGNEDVIATSAILLKVSGAGTDKVSFLFRGQTFDGLNNGDAMRSALESVGLIVPDRQLYDIGFDEDGDGILDRDEYYFQYTAGFKRIDQGNGTLPVTKVPTSLDGLWEYSCNDHFSEKDQSTWIAFMFKRVAN